MYGDSTCGQRALYALGMTQIPIVGLSKPRQHEPSEADETCRSM